MSTLPVLTDGVHGSSTRMSFCTPLTNHLIPVIYKGKGSPYSTAERGVPEPIPVLGSQPAGYVPTVGCHYFPPGPQLPSQPLTGLLPVSLLGE